MSDLYRSAERVVSEGIELRCLNRASARVNEIRRRTTNDLIPRVERLRRRDRLAGHASVWTFPLIKKYSAETIEIFRMPEDMIGAVILGLQIKNSLRAHGSPLQILTRL